MSVLRSAGLNVLDENVLNDRFRPSDAWKRIIGVNMSPIVVVDDSGEDSAAIVGSEWATHAKRLGILGENAAFLISVAGKGALTAPWAKAELAVSGMDVGRLGTSPGEPEFVTKGIDGDVVLGVTTEENGIWLIVATLGD
jgi:hypothetical protein